MSDVYFIGNRIDPRKGLDNHAILLTKEMLTWDFVCNGALMNIPKNTDLGSIAKSVLEALFDLKDYRSLIGWGVDIQKKQIIVYIGINTSRCSIYLGTELVTSFGCDGYNCSFVNNWGINEEIGQIAKWTKRKWQEFFFFRICREGKKHTLHFIS